MKDHLRVDSPSGHLRVSFPPGHDEALLPYLFETADAQWDRLARLLGSAPKGPIRVEVLGSASALAGSSGLTPEEVRTSGVVAVAKYNRILLLSPARLPDGYPYADTLAHEMVHFFLAVRQGDTVPLWMNEALAKYLETTWRSGDPGRMGRGLANLLASSAARGRLIPFASMRDSLARLGSGEDTALAYAELASFAGFLDRTVGWDAIRRVLDELKGSEDTVAFKRATSRSLEDLAASWGREVSAAQSSGPGFSWMSAETGDDAALGPDAGRHLRLAVLLRSTGRPLAAAAEYRRALATAPGVHPEILARLAAALVDGGEADEALEVAESAGIEDADYAPLARERGMALVALGRFRDAKEPLLAAVRWDPFDAAVHEALAGSFAVSGQAALAERERRLAGLWR